MTDFIRLAGWPIYPILALGLGCFAVSVRHAIVPQRSLVPLGVALGLATFFFGVLGTVLGVQITIEGISHVEPERRWIFLIGLSESLCCLKGALLCLLPATLAAGVGAWKMSRRLEEIATRSSGQ